MRRISDSSFSEKVRRIPMIVRYTNGPPPSGEVRVFLYGRHRLFSELARDTHTHMRKAPGAALRTVGVITEFLPGRASRPSACRRAFASAQRSVCTRSVPWAVAHPPSTPSCLQHRDHLQRLAQAGVVGQKTATAADGPEEPSIARHRPGWCAYVWNSPKAKKKIRNTDLLKAILEYGRIRSYSTNGGVVGLVG